MKYISALVWVFATLAASSPAPANNADINAAANNGEKGLDAALLAQEAVDLNNAGDVGLATTGAVFASIDAQFAKSTAAVAAQFAKATDNANANANANKADKDNKAADAKAAKKGKQN